MAKEGNPEAPGTGKLDINEGASASGAERPWLRVWFRCSGEYQRVYRNARGDLYVARCTKCAKSIRFAVGPGGTNRRFFEVSC